MAGGTEAHHVGLENAQTVYVAFFGMAAKQLLAHADAKYGLAK